ncbi:LysM peptidoglycan-binding domain-containing protein [Sulfitobacter sp.]|uniref:LysM peptidoglycan-binding domain-containing protein n=1 Tax=Sulfitobacter sp. TaxID=1903071 RepID=UPI003001D249
MSKMLASLGGTAGAVVAGGGMVVVLALGAYIGFGSDLSPEADPVVAASTPAQAPQTVVAEVVPKDEEAIAVSPETTLVPQKPSFDELRRETDGTTVIAGRAEPLSDVKIIVDGDEVATAKADSQGGFAAIAVLPPKDTAQVVSLSSQGADEGDEEAASLDEIILAPTKAPTVTAMAAPEPSEAAPQDTPLAKAEPEVSASAPANETVANDVPINDVPVTETVTADAPDTEGDVTVASAIENSEPEPEPARIAVLKSDETGVRLLNPVQPEAMTAIALDTIGYSDLGDVQLAGRAQPDTARVRVYLDNRSVISLPVDADGRWRGDLPNVDEGVYTLRVDEVSVDGDVSSRVETPFKRESAEVLAEASASDGPIKSITVQTGATLWAIARDRYGEGNLYLRVFEANADSIRDPDLIYPGQVFDLPN